jgi:hypothetical protein
MNEILHLPIWHISQNKTDIAPIIHFAWWKSLDKESPNAEAANNFITSFIRTHGETAFFQSLSTPLSI